MEAAYGLAITLCMIMTTILLGYYMYLKRVHIVVIVLVEAAYLALEISFFIANVQKFTHGGYVTVFIAAILASTMVINYLGKKIRKNYTEFVPIDKYKDVLVDISSDTSIPKFASNLIYLTNLNTCSKIEYKALFSITQRRPKRADNYWFVHVNVGDQPYNLEYKIQKMGADNIIRVDFYLGFRNDQKISVLLKQVLKELVEKGEIDVISKYTSLQKNNINTDFEYVLIEKELSYDNELPANEKIILTMYEWLKKLALSEEKAFGLDSSAVTVERFPMIINPIEECPIKRRY